MFWDDCFIVFKFYFWCRQNGVVQDLPPPVSFWGSVGQVFGVGYVGGIGEFMRSFYGWVISFSNKYNNYINALHIKIFIIFAKREQLISTIVDICKAECSLI